MARALGRAIKSKQSNNLLEGFKVTTNFVVTHQQFADDNLLLGATKVKEEIQIKMLLESLGRPQDKPSTKKNQKFSSSTPLSPRGQDQKNFEL